MSQLIEQLTRSPWFDPLCGRFLPQPIVYYGPQWLAGHPLFLRDHTYRLSYRHEHSLLSKGFAQTVQEEGCKIKRTEITLWNNSGINVCINVDIITTAPLHSNYHRHQRHGGQVSDISVRFVNCIREYMVMMYVEPSHVALMI